jgi:hypothetical protein
MGQGESKSHSDNSADASNAIAVRDHRDHTASVAETNQRLAESYSKTLRQVEGVVHRMQQEKVDETNILKEELAKAQSELAKVQERKDYYKNHLKELVQNDRK